MKESRGHGQRFEKMREAEPLRIRHGTRRIASTRSRRLLITPLMVIYNAFWPIRATSLYVIGRPWMLSKRPHQGEECIKRLPRRRSNGARLSQVTTDLTMWALQHFAELLVRCPYKIEMTPPMQHR